MNNENFITSIDKVNDNGKEYNVYPLRLKDRDIFMKLIAKVDFTNVMNGDNKKSGYKKSLKNLLEILKLALKIEDEEELLGLNMGTIYEILLLYLGINERSMLLRNVIREIQQRNMQIIERSKSYTEQIQL